MRLALLGASGLGGSRLVGEVFAGRGWVGVWDTPGRAVVDHAGRHISAGGVGGGRGKRLLTSGSVQPRHHMGATGRTLGSAAAPSDGRKGHKPTVRRGHHIGAAEGPPRPRWALM